MQQIRDCADLSIRRACGFGLMAIATMMVGMSSEIMLATRVGAIGSTLMMVVLLLKAMSAPARNYKRTETWLLLGKQHGLPEARRQQVIGGILRERYVWHATWAAVAAVVLWTISLLLAMFPRAAL